MTPEQEELLKRSVGLVEENNSILRGMQRSMRMASFMRVVYWLFIIGSTVGAYYLIQPYLEQITGAYSGAKSNVSGINGNLNSLLEQVKGFTN